MTKPKQDEEQWHAPLAPSGSGRWLNCFGSVLIEAKSASSIYAEEGTAAHHLHDACLLSGADPERFLGTFIYKHFEVTEEMAEAVGLSIDWINAYCAQHPNANVHTEQRVDPSALLKCEKDLCSGTCDTAIDNAPEELVIIDYKHGVNQFVAVEGNTQILLYALGFVSQYTTRPYKRYRLVIIQPRHRHEDGPVREVVITHEELLEFAEYVRKRLKAMKKNPQQRTAGKWCMFCAGAGKCKTLAEYNMQVAAMEFGALEQEPVNPHELTPEDLSIVLKQLPLFEKWLKAVYAAGLEHVARGGVVPEHKLVYGRSVRTITNKPAVMKTLGKFGYEIDDYAPRDLIGLGKIEQLIKRSAAEAGLKGTKKAVHFEARMRRIAAYVGRTQAPLHLVHESDPRAAVQRGQEFADAPLPESPAPKQKKKAPSKTRKGRK